MPMCGKIFTYAVKDNDRVINGKTDDRQDRGDHSKVNFPLKNREECEHHQNVVKHRDDSAGGIRPIVTKCNKEKYADTPEQRRCYRLVSELRSGDGSDRVGTYDLI